MTTGGPLWLGLQGRASTRLPHQGPDGENVRFPPHQLMGCRSSHRRCLSTAGWPGAIKPFTEAAWGGGMSLCPLPQPLSNVQSEGRPWPVLSSDHGDVETEQYRRDVVSASHLCVPVPQLLAPDTISICLKLRTEDIRSVKILQYKYIPFATTF